MNLPFFQADDGRRIMIQGASSIGRIADATITFEVPAISRMHAEITQRSGSCWLHDLDSKNGTFVNGERIGRDGLCLAEGDTIVFASAVTVVFHDPAATPIAPRIGRLSGVWVDPATDAVWVDAARIEPPLSARQLTLLQLLDRHIGEVVSRSEIVNTVWDDVAAQGVSDEAVAALIKRLRGRLREGPLRADYVEVVKGRGVRLLAID